MANNGHSDRELREVAVADIDTEDGFNPRAAEDEQRLAELTESVKQRGILQPLLVRHTEDERLCVVAGHRRLAAARAAGLERVPALIGDGGQALEEAITENVLREDLDCIEEARALQRALAAGKLSQKALAAKLGKSAGYVRDRLRLLRLPAQAQQGLASGQLTLATVAVLERIAKVSEQVCEACAALVQAGHAESGDLERSPARVVAMIARVEWTDGTPVAVSTMSYKGPDELPLGEHAEEIARRLAAIEDDGWGYRPPGFSFRGEADAARAYGCLLEFNSDAFGGEQFICDGAFIADRCLAQLDQMEQRARERAERRDASGGQLQGDGGGNEASIDEQEVRRQERERERDEAIAARGANLELGRQLAERFHKPKLTRPLAQLLALLVFDSHVPEYAARGLRYTDPELQNVEVRELKSGEERRKVTYQERDRCADYLLRRLDRARSAEEVLGVVLQTLVATHFAEERVTAQSHRIGFQVPGGYGYCYEGQPAHVRARKEIPELIERLGKPALPARMRDRLAAREAAEEIVGRDNDGEEVARGEVIEPGDALTAAAKQAFEEKAGPIEWSAESEAEPDAA